MDFSWVVVYGTKVRSRSFIQRTASFDTLGCVVLERSSAVYCVVLERSSINQLVIQ